MAQVLVRNGYNQRKNVCLCLTNFGKARDRVLHHKLLALLRQIHIDSKDIRCIENISLNQTAHIKIAGEQTNGVEIFKEIRQRYVLLPMLFNLYPENIFQKAPGDTEKGVNINGVGMNHIRYADNGFNCRQHG